MTFKHKLSRRLALLRAAAIVAPLLPLACMADQLGVEPQEPTAQIVQLILSPSEATVRSGESVTFTAVALTASGDTAPANVTWRASKGLMSEGNGSRPGKRLGHYKSPSQPVTDTVVVSDSSGNADTSTVTVTDTAVASVAVSPSAASVEAGKTVQLAAAVADPDGNELSGRQVTWASWATGVATVSSSGLVTGVGAGSATITATSEGQSATATVTVSQVPVASVAVSPAVSSVEAGESVQLRASVADAEGNELSGRQVTWATSATGVATVSSSGLVTGVGAGSATITATSEGQKGTASVTVTAPSGTETRVGYYAAPNGSSSGDGSIDRPWDLQTALAGGSGRVGAGDTVWVRGGSYRGAFVSSVAGTSGRPVVVRQYPGERAMIDGAPSSNSTFVVRGQWSVIWGLEILNSDPNRVSSSTSSHTRANTVVNDASHTKYVNLVVHDGGVAFYNYTTRSDVEVYGSIFYNNGWQGPDRGHGHALYVKSDAGPVLLKENVLFNQFGYGVHTYTNAGSGHNDHIRLEGNVAFNNGTLSTNSTSANVLIGGYEGVRGSVLQENLTYFSPGVGGDNLKIGYGTTRNVDLVLERNYAVGGATVLDLGYWSSAVVGGNTFIATSGVVELQDAQTGGHAWAANQHRRDPGSTSWRYNGTSYTFSGWTSTTGLGATDQATTGTPSGVEVVVRPNVYESGRAMVTVYNWARQGAVAVDLGAVLAVGQRYEVRNVQALYGAPVASGTYGGGSVSLPLSGVTPPAPIGFSSSRAPRTGPDFDVFIVTPR